MSPEPKHFFPGYAEMVVAMFTGMAVPGVPFGWLLGPSAQAGRS
jgi:hypothetical protein